MIKDKSKLFKECEICKTNASYLCFQCNDYFCESYYKFVHDKQVNLSHKKENIDPFIPIDIKWKNIHKIECIYFVPMKKVILYLYN